MTLRITLLAVLMASCPGASAAPAVQQHAQHAEGHSHSASGPRLVLNKGAKWETDEALRKAMLQIRRAVELDAGHAHSIEAAKAARLATAVQDGVAYMVENCKLAPEADAVLHVLVADMLRGAELLAQPHHANEGLALVHGALEQYPAYFRHAGWD